MWLAGWLARQYSREIVCTCRMEGGREGWSKWRYMQSRRKGTGWSHFCKEDWKEVKEVRGRKLAEGREGGKRNMGSMRGIKLALTAVAESKDRNAEAIATQPLLQFV